MRELSLALVGLEAGGEAATPAERLRAQLEFARGAGCRGVQWNGVAAGMRARELDRSARRDIAATLKRLELGFSGVDLFVPPEHFTSAANQDRAISAVGDAVELAAELAGLMGGRGGVVAVELPEKLAAEVRRALAEKCELSGVRLADCAWRAGVERPGPGPLARGLDPAAVLMGGGDPAAEAARLGSSVACARLSDVSASGRVAAGSGRLDVLAYRVALEVGGAMLPVVLDLRGVREQGAGAKMAVVAWGGGGTNA